MVVTTCDVTIKVCLDQLIDLRLYDRKHDPKVEVENPYFFLIDHNIISYTTSFEYV
jgi:hypothetical protein